MRMAIKKHTFVSEMFGNRAIIEELAMKPYKGGSLEKGYRLCCYADYDDGILYHCSCYETYKEAFDKMMNISCGKWKEVK